MTRALVLRAGRLSLRASGRAVVVDAILACVLLGCVTLALMLGSRVLSPGEVLAALAPGADATDRLVVLEWRAPRALAAALFGACLGLSGAIFQSLTRNPLGSPDVIGLSAGSYTGVVCVLSLGGAGYLALATGAVVGGLATALTVYLLAFRRGMHGFRLIIVGIAISAMLSSVNRWFSVKADLDVALQVAVWGAGTLNNVEWLPLSYSAMAALALVLVLPAAGRRMRQLELGDDTAGMLGLSVERTKILLVVLGTALTAVVTAITGPVAFIALAAPQIARRLTGHGSVDLTGAALTGAVLLSTSDLIAQHAISGVVLPVGAVTVCLGGGYLVWLLVRESKNS
ncbi:iron ABC transporter permease [Prauserella marina]|uniref:Iron complex transport system permease protein n=1 Tax=Prauserella marina TaxID=530584 RepID=A0A222VP43_9PSEU|nr:iron chelate uptake ABC transporter family permease subunit [Prauserella marina]ASR35677.1 iron ABC transporter permease [Prauserella marina]PWV84447.1 iron complex transport system permease protein [Prauserella marina]SDC22345.1 iron complex transport system permease protein [Prauserella marina]